MKFTGDLVIAINFTSKALMYNRSHYQDKALTDLLKKKVRASSCHQV